MLTNMEGMFGYGIHTEGERVWLRLNSHTGERQGLGWYKIDRRSIYGLRIGSWRWVSDRQHLCNAALVRIETGGWGGEGGE